MSRFQIIARIAFLSACITALCLASLGERTASAHESAAAPCNCPPHPACPPEGYELVEMVVESDEVIEEALDAINRAQEAMPQRKSGPNP